MYRKMAAMFVAIGLVLLVAPAYGHFPWLTLDADGRVLYFFGETLAERTYKLPPTIAEAKVRSIGHDGKTTTVEFKETRTDDFVGLASTTSVERCQAILSEVTYGLYHGSRLKYYGRHQSGKLPASLSEYGSAGRYLPLDVKLVDNGSGIDAYVIWNGKPLADVEVHLYCDEGHEEGTAKTDTHGKVSFDGSQVEDGLNGIMVGHTVKGEAGELNGESYESTSHYLTATFMAPR